jgi:hypothetical protein
MENMIANTIVIEKQLSIVQKKDVDRPKGHVT